MSGDGQHLGDPDGIYPMRIVTRMTGLTADTVRVWERRYGAVRPERTDGNARRYTDREVKRLILLREATARGHSIGDIARLDEPALVRLLRGEEEEVARPRTYDTLIEEIITSVEQYDARRVHDIFARASAMLAPRDIVFGLVVPLLQTVGERWARGETTVIHEHVISAHVKGLLGTFVRIVQVPESAPRILCGAPEAHIHEFGALIASLIALTRGVEGVFIGPDVPYAEMPAAVAQSGARVVLLSVLREMSKDELARIDHGVRTLAESAEVWIGCPSTHAVARRDLPARFFHDFEAYDAAVVQRFGTTVSS